MFKIYALHGIEENVNKQLSYRNILKKNDFIDFIKFEKNNITSMADALKYNEGIVISIDDSTVASYNAALCLIELGVKGTWFFNPENIVNETYYSAAYLNQLLDSIENGILKYKDKEIVLKDLLHKKKIRKVIKEDLKNETIDENDRIRRIKELSNDNNILNSVPPHFMTPVSISQINGIYGSYIEFANHGWSHNFTEKLTINECYINYKKAKDWFTQNNYFTNNYYALPYGRFSDYLNQFSENIKIFLLDNRFNTGFLTPNIINRIELIL